MVIQLVRILSNNLLAHFPAILDTPIPKMITLGYREPKVAGNNTCLVYNNYTSITAYSLLTLVPFVQQQANNYSGVYGYLVGYSYVFLWDVVQHPTGKPFRKVNWLTAVNWLKFM